MPTQVIAELEAVFGAPLIESYGMTEAAHQMASNPLPPAKRKVIKTLQPKFFLKLHRFEFTPFVGMVTNDPFIRRIMFGGDVAYHFTELFAFELQGSFDPNFGQGDWKPITHQITGANQVSPEISRMMWHMTGNFNFSPFYGKLATVGRNTIMFDIYGTFGAGVVGTADDLELIGNAGDPRAEATRTQVHPTLTFASSLLGLGRLPLGDWPHNSRLDHHGDRKSVV